MLKFRLHMIFIILFTLLGVNTMSAANVLVNVSPKQNPLPPYALTYKDDPGKYFNITLTNLNSDTELAVRLEVALEGPKDQFSNQWEDINSYLRVAANRVTPDEIVLLPNRPTPINSSKLNLHFKQYDPNNEFFANGTLKDIFNDVENFGLLPEGHYTLKIIVKPNNGFNADVIGEGITHFDIVYKASAPKFTEPATNAYDFDAEEKGFHVIPFPVNLPRFSWTEPSFRMQQFHKKGHFVYDFCIARIMEGQTPTEAFDKHSVAFEQRGLVTPFCNVPSNIVTAMRNSGTRYYVAQVTATPMINNIEHPDYAVVEKNGKSEMIVLDLGAPEDDEGKKDEDIRIPDFDVDVSSDPVKATVTPKMAVLTNLLKPYITNPEKLFRVTLENTTTQDLKVALLLQFHKGNWGLCPTPSKQHKDRWLDLKAKEKITLSDEDLHRLAGDYNYETDAIAFKAKTGFIIGKPATDYFPETNNNVSLRVCEFTGKNVLRERIIGKARNTFNVDANVVTGEKILVTLEPKMEILPNQAPLYFDHPERLFNIKMQNLTDGTLRVHPVLSYLFEDESRLRGEDESHMDQAITLQPNKNKTLTEEEIVKYFGGFKQVVYDLNGGTMQVNEVDALKLKEESNQAFLTLYDADRLDMLDKTDEDRYTKAQLQETTTLFNTSSLICMGNIELKFTNKYTTMPDNASHYFELPQRLFTVEVRNLTDKTMRLRPEIDYLFFKGSEDYYKAKDNGSKEYLQLGPNETVTVPDELLLNICGNNQAEWIKKETAETADVAYSDITFSYDNLNDARLVMYNVDSLEKISADDPNYIERCIEGTALNSFAVGKGQRMLDIDIVMASRLPQLPIKAAPYFNRAYSIWDMELANNTNFPKKAKLVLQYQFEKDKYTYTTDKKNDISLTVDLKANERRKLTRQEINQLFCSEQIVRFKEEKNGVSEEELLTIKNLKAQCGTTENHAVLKVYNAEMLEKATDKKPTEEMLIGETDVTFQGTEGVELNDILVTLKHKMDPMPGNGNHYFKNPGIIFEAILENTSLDEHKVLPVMNFIFKEDGGYYGGSPKNRLDSAIVIKPDEKIILTDNQLNRMCGYYEEINHYTTTLDGHHIEKITKFENLVNLRAMNEAHMTVYDTDSLRQIPETEKDRNERAFMGEGKTAFKADKDVVLTTLKVEITPKKEAAFPREAETYFTDPGKYFNVTISNSAGEKAEVNLRLTFNDKYCINKPDSIITIEPEMVKKLTPEEINDLCGKKKNEKIYEINGDKHLVPAANPDDIKFKGGENKVTSLVWRKLQDQPTEIKVDTLAVADTLFVTAFREVKIGKFYLVLEEAQKDSVSSKGDDCYTGYGYIKWNPMGMKLNVSVEYAGLHVNSKGIVTKGEVFSKKPKEMFSWEDMKKELEKIAPEEYKDSLSARLEDSKIYDYYKFIRDSKKIIDDITEGKISLPARLPDFLTKNSPIDAQLSSMYFTPDTATMNVLVEFVVPESNYTKTSEGILVFAAENLPLGENTLLPKSGIVKLISDFKVKDPASGFDFTFRAPTSKEGEPTEDGCHVAWKDNAFQEVTIDASLSIPSNSIVKYHENITEEMEKEGVDLSPDIRLVASIGDAEDWYGYVTMDAFQFKDAPGYTFTLTGDNAGMLYDHSKIRTPKGVEFPKEYDWKKAGLESADAAAWQGFYFEELSVSLPKFIELNDKGTNRRLTVGMRDMIGDQSGFSCQFFAENILSKSTAKIGGWGITLDTLSLSIMQNDFKDFSLYGTFDVPLLDGKIGYMAKVISVKKGEGQVGNDVIFETRQVDDLSMDFWLAKANFTKESTYFNVSYTDFPKAGEKNTKVELCAGGQINITCLDKIDFIFKGIKFDGLRVANFAKQTATENTESEETNGTPTPVEEFKDSKGDVCFDIGKWSFASEQKDFWKMPFTIDRIYPTTKGIDQLGLYVCGKLSVMGDKKVGIGAKTGIVIWSKVDWENLSLSYDKVDFKDLEVDGQFGGGLIINGKLEVADDDKQSGYKGNLDVEVKGLFKLNTSGAYMEVTREKKNDSQEETGAEEEETTYKAGYFVASAEVNNLPSIGGVKLSSVMGGLYINYGMDHSKNLTDKDALKEALLNPVPRYKSYGGAFGLGLAIGSDNLIKGDFNLLTIVDMEHGGRLSDFHLQGKVKAMCADGADKGLINAQADIIYSDNTSSDNMTKEEELEACKRFVLNITVDAGIDDMADAYEAFTGHKLEIPAPLADLKEFSQEAADEQGDGSNGSDHSTVDADGNRTKSKAEKKAESKGGLRASAKAEANLEFEIRHYPNKDKKTFWHLYLGQPNEDDRIRITFIDFAIGKDKPIGIWAKLYANAYLCLGNELPDDGALPELPANIKEALGMDGADGKKHPEQETKLDKIRQETIDKGPHGTIDGGVMFGAALGGEFGCNALFCYADVRAELGFDFILKKFSKDCRCTDGKPMGGKNGFYATGQLYAMLAGELGLMIDLWIFKGKVPLVDMSVGALLKGGFPNPSWGYGRLRAKGQILGGLIKFNSTIEAKMGRVCIPEYGNPLEDVKIFGDVNPGEDDLVDGWNKNNAADCYTAPTFTTNMRIDSRLTLVDENARANMAGMNGDEEKYTTSASRTYVFHLYDDFRIQQYEKDAEDDERPVAEKYIRYKTMDRINFTLVTGSLEPQTRYKLTLRGYCKEIVNGQEVDPIFKDKESNYKNEHRKWDQECLAYFLTGNLSDNLNDEVIGFVPDNGDKGGNLEEVTQPYAMLQHVRDDYFDNPDYEFRGEVLERYEHTDRYLCPDIDYTNGLQRIGGKKSKFEDLEVVQHVEEFYDEELNAQGGSESRKFVSVGLATPLPAKYFETGKTYRFRIYRTNTKKMEKYFADVEEKYNSIMKMTKEERENFENELKEMKDSKDTVVMRDLYNYFMDVEEKYGENTAEQRMREYADAKKAESSAYTDVIIERSFTYNGKKDFHEQLLAEDGYFQMTDSKANYRRPQFSLTKISNKSTAAKTVHNNPYRALNYWQSIAAVLDSTLNYVLCDLPYNSPIGLSYTADYPTFRKANTSNRGKLYDNQFEECYSPEFAHLSKNMDIKWHTVYGATGREQLHNFVDSIKEAFRSDSRAATLLEDTLHRHWKQYTNDNYNVVYKKSGPYDTAYIYNTMTKNKAIVETYLNKMKKEQKNYFSKWRKSMNLAMSPLCMIEINLGYSLDKPTLSLPEPQFGLMYAASDPDFTLGMKSHCTYSYAGKYLSGEERLYDGDQFVEYTKDNVYVIDIRRCSGYDINHSEFALRASNAYQNTVKATIQAGRIDDNRFNPDNFMVEFDDVVNIVDVEFKKYLIENFDTNHDGKLQRAEAREIAEIAYTGQRNGHFIGDLTGIEAMPNLTLLSIDNCEGHGLHNVNLAYNKKLSTVIIKNSGIRKLDIRMNKEVSWLSVNDNYYLSDIRIPAHNKISWFHADNCGLTHLDMSNMKHVSSFSCMFNMLDTLDLNNCHHLEKMKVGNQYTSKSVNKKPLHMVLTVAYNNAAIKYLNATGARPLSEYQQGKAVSNISDDTETTPNANVFFDYQVPDIWDLDKNLATYLVNTYGKQAKGDGQRTDSVLTVAERNDLADRLTAIDTLNIDHLKIKSLEGLDIWTPNLKYLRANNNYIENLDLTNFTRLRHLEVQDNRIEEMYLPETHALNLVNCENNNIRTLDLEENTGLSKLYCDNNEIKEINLSQDGSLRVLHCTKNNMNELDLSHQAYLSDLDVSYNAFYPDENSPKTGTRLALPESTNALQRFVGNSFTGYKAQLDLAAYVNLKYVDISKSGTVSSLKLPQGIEQLRARDCYALSEISPSELGNLSNLTTFNVANSRIGKTLPAGYSRIEEFDITSAHLLANGKINPEAENISLNSGNLKVVKIGDPKRMKGKKIRVDLQTPDMVTLWQNTWSHYEENQWTVIAYYRGQKLDPKESDNVETITEEDLRMKDEMGSYYETLKEKYNPRGRMLHTEDVEDITVLNCANSKLTHLTGIIKWMPRLKELYAGNNEISTVNLSFNKELEIVDLSNNSNLSSITTHPAEASHSNIQTGNIQDSRDLDGNDDKSNWGAPFGKKIKVLNVSHTNVFSESLRGGLPAGTKTGMDYALTLVSDRIIAVGATGGGQLNIDDKVYVRSLNLTDADVRVVCHDGEYTGAAAPPAEETDKKDVHVREEAKNEAFHNSHDVIANQIKDKGQVGLKPGRGDVPGMGGAGRLPNIPGRTGGQGTMGNTPIGGNRVPVKVTDSKAISSTVVPNQQHQQMGQLVNQKQSANTAIRTQTGAKQAISRNGMSQSAGQNVNVSKGVGKSIGGAQRSVRNISRPAYDEAPERPPFYLDIEVEDTIVTPVRKLNEQQSISYRPQQKAVAKQQNSSNRTLANQQDQLKGTLQGQTSQRQVIDTPVMSIPKKGRLDSLICDQAHYDIILPAADWIYSINVFHYGNSDATKGLKFRTADLALKWILEWSQHGQCPTADVIVCVKSGTKSRRGIEQNDKGLFEETTVYEDNYFKYTLPQLLEAVDKGMVEKGKYYDTFYRQLQQWISTTTSAEKKVITNTGSPKAVRSIAQ